MYNYMAFCKSGGPQCSYLNHYFMINGSYMNFGFFQSFKRVFIPKAKKKTQLLDLILRIPCMPLITNSIEKKIRKTSLENESCYKCNISKRMRKRKELIEN